MKTPLQNGVSRALLVTMLLLGRGVVYAERTNSIDHRMRTFVEEGKIPGAVTLVARCGKVVHLGTAGLADIEANVPTTTNTLFAIASMTKPIAATAVMILQDEGRLSVDDPVAGHIPSFNDVSLEGGKPERPLTIRLLLTHTSGLTGSQHCADSLEKTVEKLAEQKLSFEPGTRWQYSPGMNVCGRIVEVVANQPLDAFLTERIFEPLGMRGTTFLPTVKQRKRLATIYRPGAKKGSLKRDKHWFEDYPVDVKAVPSPSGGLFSTAADMATFYQMILNGGELNGKRIVSKRAVRQMLTVQTGNLATGFTPGNGWGLGWCVVRKPQGVTDMLSPGSFGHGGAFGTQGWVDPQKQMIFVLMIARKRFGNSDASTIRRDFQQLAVEAFGR
jgi:CubicO group peptidase (beta-lactamase class C family)